MAGSSSNISSASSWFMFFLIANNISMYSVVVQLDWELTNIHDASFLIFAFGALSSKINCLHRFISFSATIHFRPVAEKLSSML